jgi:hypothetical protein
VSTDRAAVGDGSVLGAAAVRLRVRINAPAGSKTATGATNLMAPRKPLSITGGKQEQRAYEIRMEVPASSSTAITAPLTIEASQGRPPAEYVNRAPRGL